MRWRGNNLVGLDLSWYRERIVNNLWYSVYNTVNLQAVKKSPWRSRCAAAAAVAVAAVAVVVAGESAAAE